jgi:hypothetical protein
MRKLLFFVLLNTLIISIFAQNLIEDEYLVPNSFAGKGYIKSYTPPVLEIMPFAQEREAKKVEKISLPTYHFIPATYDTLSWDTVLLVEAYTYYELKADASNNNQILRFSENGVEYEISPPAFKTEIQRRKIRETNAVWVEGKNKRLLNCMGKQIGIDIYKMEIPTQYKVFQIKTLQTPAKMHLKTSEKHTVFEIYPPSPYLKVIHQPAQYAYIPKIEKLTDPKIEISLRDSILKLPPQYSSKYGYYLVSEEDYSDFREVICCDYAPPAEYIFAEVQKKLISLGYYKGEIKVQADAEIRKALVTFQKENNLPVGRIDSETLKKLGISYH